MIIRYIISLPQSYFRAAAPSPSASARCHSALTAQAIRFSAQALRDFLLRFSAQALRDYEPSQGSHPVFLRTKARKLSLPGLLCGKTGIRTLGARKGTTVFETAPIDHSGIFPYISRGRTGRFVGAKVLNVFDVRNIQTRISTFIFSTYM